MKITVWGGAGEHGRACFLIEHRDLKLLLDCGAKKGGDRFPRLAKEIVPKLDLVLLSHIHDDHSGAIPLLYQYGYTQQIWGSRCTGAYLRKVGGRDEDCKASYRALEDYAAAQEWTELIPGLQILWGRSCHAPGAIWFILDIQGKKVIYTGDYTGFSPLWSHHSLLSPALAGRIDLSLLDMAQGMMAQSWLRSIRTFLALVGGVLQNAGNVLLPLPLYGRGQDILLLVTKFFPGSEIWVDEAIYRVLQDSLQRPDILSHKGKARVEWLLKQSNWRILPRNRPVDLARPGKVVLVAGAMLDSDLAKAYFEVMRFHSENALIFTGHLEPGTCGYRVFHGDRETATMAIHHQTIKIHQDIGDVRRFCDAVQSEYSLLVHADQTVTARMVADLRKEGYCGIRSLIVGESWEIF
jgi:cleavage and polyadenylation specificity factor subunit 3